MHIKSTRDRIKFLDRIQAKVLSDKFTTMIYFSSFFLVGLVACVTGESKNVFRIDRRLASEDFSNLEYAVEDMNVLPILSRDLTLLERAIDSIHDGKCRDHSRLMFEGLKNLTTWAVKFYDSSGKFPEGVFGGSLYQLGNFDECLEIGENYSHDDSSDETPVGIKGQYCLGEVKIFVPDIYLNKKGSVWTNFRHAKARYEETIDKLHLGICVPASCSNYDVERVIERVLAVAFGASKIRLDFKIPDTQCYKNQPHATDTLDIVYMSIISTITSIIAVGTIFHMAYLKNKSVLPRGVVPDILIAFSLISNLKKLCGPANEDGLNLDCISGIKFISMLLIVAGHTLVFVVSGPVLNKTFWEQAIGKVENSVFLNNPLLVDTFLFLSGFLLSRLLLRELDKRKSINFLLLYIFRYIRLTPAYMVMVGLYLTWLPRLGSGPLWFRMYEEQQRCRASWWANILYVNNYVSTDKLCMFQSWYLSVDTQLFILAPAIIYPLWKWRRPGEFILAGVTALSMVIPFIVTLLNHLDPSLMIYTTEIRDISTNEYFKNTYIKTHMRASAYCFGLVFGYILYRIQLTNYRLSTNTVRISWALAAFSLIASMCSISLFYGPRKNFTALEAAIYASLHRALWSAGTGWVLLACMTDNSGPVKNFLSWRPFVPLSRLTYSAYLMNGLVELFTTATARTPQHLDKMDLFSKVLSHLMLTFIGAVILSTMFESPILGFEKIFHRPHPKTGEGPKKCEETPSNEV